MNTCPHRVRCYFHGDAHEAERGLFLCRRCDWFLDAEHFEPGQCPFNRAGRDDATLIRLDAESFERDAARAYRRAGILAYRPIHAPTVWNRARD